MNSKFSASSFKRVDLLGMFLLLASSILLIFALEEGGTRYAWDSGAIISTLVLAVVTGIAFWVWELLIDNDRWAMEPVFPPSILRDRLLSAMLM
jgi:hypothetical protein